MKSLPTIFGPRWNCFAPPAVILLAAAVAVVPQLAARQLLRPRLRLPSGLVVRLRRQLAARDSLSALGAERQLRRRRAALHLLSAADLDAGRGAGARAALDAGARGADLSAAGRDGPGHAGAGAADARDGAATLAGCAALFSGYALFTAYERSAFGELAGGFWIPLVLLFALRDRNPCRLGLRARALDGSAAAAGPGLRRLLALEPPARRDGLLPAGRRGAGAGRAGAILGAGAARRCWRRRWAWAWRPFIFCPPPGSSAGSIFARPPAIPARRSKTVGSLRGMPIRRWQYARRGAAREVFV